MSAEKMLLVRLGTDFYALPLETIEEVLPALPIEALPHCPSYVRGAIFVRGHVIPVVDAAQRLGCREAPSDEETTIVCVRVGTRLVGIEFDEAVDLVDLPRSEALPSGDFGSHEPFFAGVVAREGRLIRLLDPTTLASCHETAGSAEPIAVRAPSDG